MLGKIIALIGMRKTSLVGIAFFQSLLIRVAVVLMSVLIMAILIAFLIAAIILYSYRALVEYGLSPDIAVVVMGAVSLLIIGIFGMAIITCAHSIHNISKSLLNKQSPIANRVTNVVNAFLDGMLTRRKS